MSLMRATWSRKSERLEDWYAVSKSFIAEMNSKRFSTRSWASSEFSYCHMSI